jgi:hypothetical protein
MKSIFRLAAKVLAISNIVITSEIVAQTSAGPTKASLSFDSFLNWNAPFDITKKDLEQKLGALAPDKDKPVFRIEGDSEHEIHCIGSGLYLGYDMTLSMFDGSQTPLGIRLGWLGEKLSMISIPFSVETPERPYLEALRNELDRRVGVSGTSFIMSHTDGSQFPGYKWEGATCRVETYTNKNIHWLIAYRTANSSKMENSNRTEDSKSPTNISFDAILNWDAPFDITRSDLERKLGALAPDKDKPVFRIERVGENENYLIGAGRYAGNDLVLSMFDGSLLPKGINLSCSDGELRMIEISFPLETPDKPYLKALRDELDRRIGTAGVPFVMNHPNGRQYPGHQWKGETCNAETYTDDKWHWLTLTRGVTTKRVLGMNDVEPSTRLSANLDSLLSFSTLWSTSADAFGQLYTSKAADPKAQKKPPQFEWMNSEKSRARFSRQMFSNVETKLSMFAGSIKVEEAVVEFVNGKAAKSTISFYNRGDSGDIEVKEFDRIFKTIGQNLGQVLKVAPKRQLMSTNAALPVSGWMWTSPMATALLEYNEYQVPGKVIKPEFLRLKLAAPGQSDYTMGKMVTGVQSMELIKRVTKKPDGEVHISGVPMVDQGQKGYCVAASCQRLFEYMRIPCDQHEMAQLVNVDAESGANVFGMQKSLAKIDGRFKVSFKPLVNPEQYYSGSSGKRRVSDKEFNSIVKEYVNKGVPLLWALELGRADEEPPLPGAGQTRGGHMRMIIGYKMENNLITKILFTDSWGSGHELKRMAAYDAYDVTIGLYSMAPRGL